MRASSYLDRIARIAAVIALSAAACQPLNNSPTRAAPSATAFSPPLTPALTAPPRLATTTAPAPATATTTATAAATPTPQLEIVRLSSQQGPDGANHLFGEVHNRGAVPITDITLQLDWPGHAPITTTPALAVIAAGQSAPFDLSLPADIPPPASLQLAITSSRAADLETASVSVEQLARTDPGDGQFYLTGLLANAGARPIQIAGLAAVEVGPAGMIQSLGQSPVLVHYIAPGQQAPFSILLPSAQPDDAQWMVYPDARPVPPADAALTVTLTNAYHDECGCLELAGLVRNAGAQALVAPLVAAVYDTQGQLQMVQSFSTTLPVAPGAQLPFGIRFGASVSTNLAPERATVQVDLAGVAAPAAADAVPLPVQVVDQSQSNWELAFDAAITNTSSQTLTGLDILAAVYNRAGHLVAAEPFSISATDGGALPPGEALPFNATLLLDNRAEPGGVKLVLTAQGRLH